MNRRNILKSLGALAASPALPSFAIAGTTGSAVGAGAGTAITPSLYKWAEMIARAHNQCSTAMLQRNLKISAAQAAKLHSTLFTNGVIGSRNAYGIAKATNPLWEGAFPKAPGNISSALTENNVLKSEKLITSEAESNEDIESRSGQDQPDEEAVVVNEQRTEAEPSPENHIANS